MLQDTLRSHLTDAMRAKEEPKLTVLRGVITAITNELVSKGKTPRDTLTDEEILAVITRLAKQRKDSIEQYEGAGREVLAEAEKAELEVLNDYLPTLMTKDEIRPIAEAKMTELGVTDKAKAGQLVGALMKELKGKADGAEVKAVVEELLH